MPDLRWSQLVARALLEILVWMMLSSGFLLLYVFKFGGSSQSVIPHLLVLSNVVLACVTVRVMAHVLVRRREWAEIIDSTILASVGMVCLTYYALVLIGLSSWGRVVSWRLIVTYLPQAGELVSSFGVPATLAWLTLAGIWMAAVALTIRCQRPAGWVRAAVDHVSTPAAVLIACGAMAIVLVHVIQFQFSAWARMGEPVSLTVFPGQGSRLLQSHSTEEAHSLDYAEDSARNVYLANPAAHKRNVIVIVGDALRPDHMSAYGYPRSTTPWIDQRLSQSGSSRVEHMVGACAESSCGLMAMATSKYVHQLSPRSFSLQQALQMHGYRIHMILGGDHTNFYGLREAYGTVDEYFDGTSAPGYYMNDDEFVVRHVAEMPAWDGQPRYFQFHLMSSHALGKRHEFASEFMPATNYGAWTRTQDPVNASPGESNTTVNFYDNGVVQFDNYAGQIITTLQDKGYLDDAIVIITGDHGEMLGEHQQFGHAKGVYENELRIPFLLFRYGNEHSRPVDVHRFASQIDIAPTIAFELEVPIPSTWSGVALQLPSERRMVMFQQGNEIGLFDVSRPDHIIKYWRNMSTREEFAFAIQSDSAERNNLISTLAPAVLDEWRLSVLPLANVTIDH